MYSTFVIATYPCQLSPSRLSLYRHMYDSIAFINNRSMIDTEYIAFVRSLDISLEVAERVRDTPDLIPFFVQFSEYSAAAEHTGIACSYPLRFFNY